MLNFCTLFDSNYLTRGLALYNSLLRTSDVFSLFVVCFDDLAYDILVKLRLPSLIPIRLKDFECSELLNIKKSRTRGEYCWTCTPFVIRYVLEHFKVDEVTYLDSDMYFFNKPSILLNEFYQSGASVSISPHNFSPVYQWQQKRAGKYCVEFITFKANKDGLRVLSWWQEKCIEWCYADFDLENERFGDQKYLDKWTELFDCVHELKHIGAGVAPWNIQKFSLGVGPVVNGVPVVFYHYHGFKWDDNNKILLASYMLPVQAIAEFYTVYIQELRSQANVVKLIVPDFMGDREKTGQKPLPIDQMKTLIFRLWG